MRLSLPKLLLCPLLAAFWLSCDQDLNSAGDQHLVDYVVVVTDSANAAPLDSVRIRVTTLTGDTSTHFTDAREGRAELPTLSSSRTLFVLSRSGYRTRDLIDTVTGAVDTAFRLPKAKILTVRMSRLGDDTALHVQYTVAFRTAELARLRMGRVGYTDSLGLERTAVDEDSDGVVELTGMRIGDDQTVRAEHPGYLGRQVPVKIGKRADSVRFAPGTTLTLLPLSSSISGQVNYQTALGPKGLADAKVVFRLKDTLALPASFEGRTSSSIGSEGWFEIRNVPGLEGEIKYYRNAATDEHLALKSLTAEEVLRDGPLAGVSLAIPLDSLAPVVDSLPKDSLSPGDTLVFHFNQPVERQIDPVVKMMNAPQRLFTSAKMDPSKRFLKVIQSQDEWAVGKTYSYEFQAVNGAGQAFTRPGDSATVIRGTFSVRERKNTDTNLVLPEGIRIAGFNSGTDRNFDTSAAESSPKGDSTTRYARMKWAWPAKAGKRVDSLLVFIKDAQEHTSWTQLQAIPGFADSATLDFSDIYSTASAKDNALEIFPLLLSAHEEIRMKVVFIEAGRFLDGEVDLPSVTQGMGPAVYTDFDTSGVVRKAEGQEDTLFVSFKKEPGPAGPAIDFGSHPADPKLFVGDLPDNTNLVWQWVDGKNGLLMYRVTEQMGLYPRLRVEVGELLIDGKPVWQRDRKTGFRLF